MIDRRAALLLAGAGVAASACAAPAGQTEANVQASLAGYAANVESWYLDTPFLERFDRAARDGFTHIEMWGVDGEGRGPEAVGKAARDAGVNIIQIVGGAPELAQASNRQKWLDACARTVEVCDALDCEIATIVGHNNVDGIRKADSLKTYAEHMAAAAPVFEAANVFAAIEPFNPYDHPGHFVYGSADAAEMVRAIGSDFIKLNYDLFHMQRHEGELIGNLKRHAETICYVQLADAPDRGQPGTGDVNYARVIQQVRAGGYNKPIGLEFWAKDGDYLQAVADMLALSRAVEALS
jgi:hydroxypyruvate isomerase